MRFCRFQSQAIFLSIGLWVAVTHGAFGQAEVREGFSTEDLTVGQTVDNSGGGTGWVGDWTVDTGNDATNRDRYQASDYSLEYTDNHGSKLVTTPGSLRLETAGSGPAPMSRTFASPLTGEVWFSFLSIRTTRDAWGQSFRFLNADGETEFLIENDGNNRRFRIRHRDGDTASLNLINDSDDDSPQGQLYVGRVTNAGSTCSTATTAITLWANPANLEDLGEGAAASTSLTVRLIDPIAQFLIRKDAFPRGFFDELRLGRSAEAVMPIERPDSPFRQWLTSHFSPEELLDEEVTGPFATPAGDGVGNLLKFVLGLDPKKSSREFLPTPVIGPGGVSLTYEHAREAIDTEVVVEVSTDLVTWESGSEHMQISLEESDEAVIVTAKPASRYSDSDRLFIRLRPVPTD